MAPLPALAGCIAAALLLGIAAGIRVSRLAPLVPLACGTLLVVYVLMDDTYRADGTSRWDAYRSPGGALGPLFFASLALLVACTTALAYTAFTRKHRAYRLSAMLGTLAVLLVVLPTFAGFSLN